jgi:hypothetical protein
VRLDRCFANRRRIELSGSIPRNGRASSTIWSSFFSLGFRRSSRRANQAARSGVERGIPQPRRLEQRGHTRGQLVRGEPADVLLVEPVELVGIEHGVAAADAPSSVKRAMSSSA